MFKIDLNSIAQSAKVLRGVGLETAADITERLVFRVRELEAALEKYGRHEVRHCPKSSYYGNPLEGPCNCGLDTAKGVTDAK